MLLFYLRIMRKAQTALCSKMQIFANLKVNGLHENRCVVTYLEAPKFLTAQFHMTATKCCDVSSGAQVSDRTVAHDSHENNLAKKF
jgi:hypothetical protein